MRKKGSSFSEAQRDTILKRDKGICVYCRGKGYEVDHVVPRSKGGPAICSNGVVTCSTCNHKKGASVEFDWVFVAFFHLLDVGESLDWLDKFWNEKLQKVRKRIQTISEQPIILLDKLPSHVMEASKPGCLNCRIPFQIVNPGQRFCSTKCKKAWTVPHGVKLPESVCVDCSTHFTPTRFWQKFCTPQCRSVHWERANPRTRLTDPPS